MQLEGEALALAYKHILRAGAAVGRRVVALVDNACLALACCKGRAKSVHLQSVMLKLASLLLASGCRLHVRWVPSGRNPSDRLFPRQSRM
eukprot:1511060-Pyramimonas_sp.AAC.1